MSWAKRVSQASADDHEIGNHNFTNAQTPGLSIHEPGYHRSNGFRYAAEFYSLRDECPLPQILSAGNRPAVVWRYTRLRLPRLGRSDQRLDAYFLLLSRHYRRLIRRLHREIRSPRTIHFKLRNAARVLRSPDWTYLLVRALWEQRSAWSLDDISTTQGRFDVPTEIEVGEELHQSATQYFSFRLFEETAAARSHFAWSNIHLWTAVFMQTVRLISQHLHAGGRPEQAAESVVQAFSQDYVPFTIFRSSRPCDGASELYMWPLPDSAGDPQ